MMQSMQNQIMPIKNQMIKTIANRLNSPAITNEHVADAFATSICHWVMFSSIKKV